MDGDKIELPPKLVLESTDRGSAGGKSQQANAHGKPAPKRKARSFGAWEAIKVVLGGAAGLGIGYLVVFWIQAQRAPDSKTKLPRPQSPRIIARASSTEKMPEFRPPAQNPPALSAPIFTPPTIGFGPPAEPSRASNSVASEPTSGAKRADDHAKQARSPQQPEVKRQDLEGLPTALKLPSLVDTTSTVLCPLHVPAGKMLDISINAVAANLPAEAAFLTERDASEAATWLVTYVPDLNGAPQDKKPLAELKHDSGELAFTWRSPIEDAAARRELSNCLLQVSCESTSKTTCLRVPHEAPRLIMDLSREVSTHSIAALDLPKEESLRLEIAALAEFPGGAVIRQDKRLLKLKERATIEFAQFPGAEIQLEFRRHPSGEMQVVMRPEFRENSAEKVAMTLPRLADLKKGLEKAIPEAEAKIVSLSKDAVNLDQQLRDLGPRPNGAAFVAWQSKRTRLESALSSCKSQASRLQRRLPEMKARLAAVPQMEQFLGGIHQKSALTLKIFAECGEAQLTIVDARLASSAVGQP